MTDKAELQRISRLVEVNRQRLEQVEQQINQLETVKNEHRETGASLGALNESTDSLVPLGSGVHLPISEQGNVVVDIGSNIFAERTLISAQELIIKRQNDLQSVIDELNEQKTVAEESIRKLVKTFEESAQTPSVENEELASNTLLSDSHNDEEKKKDTHRTKRGRGFGGELTLDD
ncbi:MAG: prefoldin subunit alpha [Candidatus Poseidoniaceae archaeon]|jgi:prefoldin alpha subunit|nr:prefoldin subunit alpha [Candidatus Poseidoniaceae archaeon]MDP7311877.1 prefoldin subunit alpha [Candidatus Thalassarchaeaceae archaeon]|tara:strand:+ start:1291 stop:1818 length:528 start_codon:yes stop_codon:yes gene_type:complete